MKKVREYLLEQEPVGDGGDPFFVNAPDSRYDNNQNGTVTGGGRVQNYPVSARNVRWLRTQTGSFAFGYLRAHDLADLKIELLGTDLSASVIIDAGTEYDALGDRQSDEQDAAAAELSANGVTAEYDRLTAIYIATAAERSALLTRMGNYIHSGKINDSDPYRLDHPELARANRRKAELERRYQEALRQLAADNEALKSETAKRNLMFLLELGFGIATAIAAINFITGPADELSLQALKLAIKKGLSKKAVKKELSKKAIEKAAKKPFQDASDDVIRAITDPKVQVKANDAVARAPKGFKNDVYIDVNVANPSGAITTQRLNAAEIVRFKKFQLQSFQPSGKLLTESKKRVLKNIKKPYEVPELPKKYKMNFAGKYSPQNTPDQTASQITDALVASGNAKGQKWRLKDKAWQGYETSERMNIVYDKVGHGDQVMDMIVGENERKRKDRQLQEKLNIIAHEKALMKENPSYETPFNQNLEEQETLSADNDPLFKKVSKSLKRSVDYPKKPSKKGYPNDPPPKMVNGYHPDLVDGIKVSNYYNTLDPNSAKAMPKTGNDFIDMKVDAAKKGKYANRRDK